MLTDAETLGAELRRAREARQLTLDRAEQQTRIRAKYLEAFEQGSYSALPSPVQARGFLRNYARFLGLDADLIVAQFDDILANPRRRRKQAPKPEKARQPQATLIQPDPIPAPTPTVQGIQDTQDYTPPPAIPNPHRPPQPKVKYAPAVKAQMGKREDLVTVDQEPQTIRRILIGGVLLIVLALLVVGALGLQSVLTQINRPVVFGLPATSTPLSAIATQNATATPLRPTPLPIPVTATPANNVVPPAVGTAPANGGVAVSLQITFRTWMRVKVDGKITYEGSAGPGTVLQYQGTAVQVRAANAIGVDATVNGRDLGALGNRGQIVDEIFTASGVATSPPPTPSASKQTDTPDPSSAG